MRTQTLRLTSTILLALLWALPAPAATLTGRVVRVVDGDTLVVLSAGDAQHKVRLAGIDAPERAQPYGHKSTEHLAGLVAGRFVVVDWEKWDRYGRIVGKVLLAHEDVCLEQVQAGLAWHFKRYQSEQTPADRDLYSKAEDEAREAKRRLWADPGPIAPWDWRRGTRPAPPVREGPNPAASPQAEPPR